MAEAINFFSGGILLTGNNYQRMPVPTMLRTDMESGPSKQRPNSSVMMIQHSVTYVFTYAEYNSFMTWYKTTAAFGSLWFNWNDPTDGVTKSGRIVGGTITNAQPQSASVSHWAVQMVIEVYG
jgi:hypothetical protein